MYGYEVIEKAYQLKHYVYWYGGKRQKCTQSLLTTLSSQYTKIYTNSYIKKCKTDIANNEMCMDCSGLVCYAMSIPDIGSYQISKKYPTYSGNPKNGMMLYKQGHIALYNNGYVVEARGIDYDFSDTRKYNPSEWLSVHYDPNINYDKQKPSYSVGWHHDTKGWWYADTDSTYLKDGYYRVPWSGNINGTDYFYFDKSGYMIETNADGVIQNGH